MEIKKATPEGRFYEYQLGRMGLGLSFTAFRQKSFNFLLQIGSGVHVDQFAFFIDQPHRRDGVDAKALAKVILPPLAVEILWPGHVFFFDKAGELTLRIVEADAQDFKALGMQFFIGCFHVG